MKKPRKAAIAFIMITVLLDVLSLGLIIPVLPELIKQLAGGDESFAAYYAGIFGTTWAFMQFFCAPILGALSDHFGRRPVLLVSTFMLGVVYIMLALAPNLTWLFIARILSGMMAANFSTAQAYLADVTTPEKRTAAFGLFGAAFGAGFILGPVMGGILGEIDIRLPFWSAAGLTIASWFYGYFVLPESLAPENRSSFHWKRANPLGSLQLLRSKAGLLPMAMTLFFYQLAHLAFQNIFVFYTGRYFQWTPMQVGLTLGTVGILNFVVQGGLIRPATKRFGERKLVFVGLIGGILGFAGYAMARNGNEFFYVTFIFALLGFFQASINGVMSTRLGPTEQGRLSGANSSMIGIAGLIGPALYSYIFIWSLKPERSPAMQGAPFAVASLLLLTALIIAYFVVPKRATTPAVDANPGA